MSSPNVSTPIEEFAIWLPGELIYSASKAGYDKKVNRAHLPIENPQSIYGFLGEEWYSHQRLVAEGHHYVPFHGKSAQLQLAKFAAGLFDKVALGTWIVSGTPTETEHFVAAVNETVPRVVDLLPMELTYDQAYLEGQAFEETPFAPGIRMMMDGIRRASVLRGDERREAVDEFQLLALELGMTAASYYHLYVDQNLTPEQYALPVSELAA